MISTLVKEYQITTQFKGEPKQTAGFVSGIADLIAIRLFKRSGVFENGLFDVLQDS
jgi:hypothetical protein